MQQMNEIKKVAIVKARAFCGHILSIHYQIYACIFVLDHFSYKTPTLYVRKIALQRNRKNGILQQIAKN